MYRTTPCINVLEGGKSLIGLTEKRSTQEMIIYNLIRKIIKYVQLMLDLDTVRYMVHVIV